MFIAEKNNIDKIEHLFYSSIKDEQMFLKENRNGKRRKTESIGCCNFTD